MCSASSSRSRERVALMICLDASAGPILVVGGGATGLRKIRTLLDAGMDVTLVSPEIVPELEAIIREGGVAWERRTAERRDFEKHAFALLALSRSESEAVLHLAEGTRCLMNCCGAGELGTWSLAAQFRVASSVAALPEDAPSPAENHWYTVGVASGGRSPAGSAALKRRLRHSLEGDRS